MSKQFHDVKLDHFKKETKDSVTLFFDIPSSLRETFTFIPGQYLTLKVNVNGNELRRPYSICTAHHDKKIGVTVKKLANGKVSSYLNDQTASIDTIALMPPEGKFILKADPDKKRNHIFICAGSGITPILSMIRSVLEDEAKSSCFLLYGNKNEDSIIFKDALDDLQAKYSGQLHVLHALSEPKQTKESGLKGLFGKKKKTWDGLEGRIDKEKLDELLELVSPAISDTQFYLCGPSGLIDNMKKAISDLGHSDKNVHQEYFTAATDEQIGDQPIGNGGNMIKVILNGKEIEIQIPAGQTILDALVDAGEDPPYSCTSGACSTCVAKTKSGSVEMDVCHALDDGEIKEGYILTCQSHPRSSDVIISFDE